MSRIAQTRLKWKREAYWGKQITYRPRKYLKRGGACETSLANPKESGAEVGRAGPLGSSVSIPATVDERVRRRDPASTSAGGVE
jgi:hypothetical protein